MVRATLTLRSAVEDPGAHTQLRHGRAQQALTGIIQWALSLQEVPQRL